MTNDLTIDSLTFANVGLSGPNGSERREVSRGVNLPEILRIRHTDYIDSKTKLPGVRSQVSFERYLALSDGRIAPLTGTVTFLIPADPNITSADVIEVARDRIAMFFKHDGTGFLNLSSDVLVSKQQ